MHDGQPLDIIEHYLSNLMRRLHGRQMSEYSHKYEALDRRPPAARPDPASSPAASPPPSPAPTRSRLYAYGSGQRNRLTPAQQKILINLLQTTRSASVARQQFIEAGHGTVSKPTVCSYAKRIPRHRLLGVELLLLTRLARRATRPIPWPPSSLCRPRSLLRGRKKLAVSNCAPRCPWRSFIARPIA
jgi:hypothetical protein